MANELADKRVLVVDDDPSLLKLISMRLQGAGYKVEQADSGKQALGIMETFNPNLVISDLRMEGMDGMALFGAVRERYPGLPVIILTAHGTIPDAIEATKKGVFSYLTKPFDSQQLLTAAADAIRLHPMVSDESQQSDDANWRSAIISRSAKMEELLQQARQVADSDVSIFINSQSGTGKELLAKAIHLVSERAEAPFVAVNCAAIPESLFESELFGHTKGAFTGANREHVGLFQSANGGTLFLDEIGDMPLNFQVKLLRAIQEREVRPVGATQPISIDVRIISATHRDLEQAIQAGDFREDLYYRLNVVELQLPPLSERRDDIPLLVNHFLGQVLARSRKQVTGYSDEAMELLIAAPWPGNVRQLQNVVEQTVALCNGPLIPAELVQKALRDKPSTLPSFARARDEFERRYLADLLKATTGNVTQAARIAGRNRTEFYKLLDKHHLSPEAFRE
ncbi:sigma 54-interacting transcriptional regulator [Bowmanella yangjiangensis]|uniref:Sigma 54-interacting transcriptional regulator n=1 Tax=Bowmanella yangjiangensis TaxID=2811230 RepID=A0ABS3CSI4_9ALTE|nr:sigma 54-interacting transcriptional regulator [Bowmanella yangjiangensis]MBN7819371.1 sigma 54-interacting transcriptional regulator [Bowmanella yangjiangensis]